MELKRFTNTRGVIVYGGEASNDYGMVVAEAPAFVRSKRKQTIFNVPGRNGAVIYQEDAWEDVPKSYKVWVSETQDKTLPEQVDAIEAWLNSLTGYQRLEDSFEPDIFRLAYYPGGDGFTNKLMQAGEATLNFTCRAEKFYKSAETPLDITGGGILSNETRFPARPLIHIEGIGSVSVLIKDKTITAAVTDFINIDCETMNAYRLPAENMNNKISGEFPRIQPGDNVVTITGSVTKVTITPRYYTI